MLEKLLKRLKENIDKKTEIEKMQVDFIANQFKENKKVLEEYKEKCKLSEWEAYHALKSIIHSLETNLHLESKVGYSKVRDALNSVYVNLGYYKILSDKKLDPEMSCNNCCLTPTKKGNKVFKEYISISNY